MPGTVKLRARGTPAQVRFVHTDAPFPAFVGGYGSGKTQALCYRALYLLLRDRCPIAYYMPTYGLISDIAIPRLYDMLAGAALNPQKRLDAGRPKIEVPGYGEILFRCMEDPERIVGFEVGHSLVDELDTLPRHKAELCWNRILARNRLKLSFGHRNTIAVATTPEGFRFVYERWGKNPEQARALGYELIRASTYDNAHNLPPDYIKNLELQYPSALLHAYLHGEFVNLEDSIIQPVWFKTSPPPAGLKLAMGVDLAISLKDTADRTAFVLMGQDEDGRLFVVHAEAGRWTFEQTLNRIVELYRSFRPATVAIESVQYQAALIQELNRKTFIPVVAVRPEKDKATRLMPLAARYEQGLVWHAPNLYELEDELSSFPNGAHDDLVDALVYAYEGLQRGQTGYAAIRRKRY